MSQSQRPLRLLFAGTPEIAVPALREAARGGGSFGDSGNPGWEVAGVLTNPDRRAGRGRKRLPSAVKAAAQELGLPVLQPPCLKKEARDQAAGLKADLLVVFAYGRIFGPRFLNLFPRGGINIHPSRLPFYRGPSPLSAVIRAGETTSALSIQTLAQEMDSGDILFQEDFALDPRETTESLTRRVARLAPQALGRVLTDFCRGEVEGSPQDHGKATYCRLLTKEDGRMDWSLSAEELDRIVRSCTPWPTAWTHWGDRILKIHRSEPAPGESDSSSAAQEPPGRVLGIDKKNGILVQTGRGRLYLQELQLPGKKSLNFIPFVNGSPDFIGTQLESL